ncbi:MAG: rhodanese-like domain-containing protein, partial [Bryocella sp.]
MDTRIIDVREYPEYASGHIENSELVPLATLRTAARTWDPTTPLLLVCKSGRR